MSAQRAACAGLRRPPTPFWVERRWAIVGAVGIRAKILGIHGSMGPALLGGATLDGARRST